MATFMSHTDDATASPAPGVPAPERERRVRLTLDLPEQLHLRLKLLAAQEHVAMRDIVEAVLDRELPPLQSLMARRPLDVSHLPAISLDSLKRFEAARATIMRGRTFTTDSATLLREARDEEETRLGNTHSDTDDTAHAADEAR